MNSLWKIIKGVSAVIGFILAFGAVGTSDYYNLELHQTEPEWVKWQIIFGVALMLPLLISMISKAIEEGREDA